MYTVDLWYTQMGERRMLVGNVPLIPKDLIA